MVFVVVLFNPFHISPFLFSASSKTSNNLNPFLFIFFSFSFQCIHLHTVFFNSGFKRSLCGSTWASLTGRSSFLYKLGSSPARLECHTADELLAIAAKRCRPRRDRKGAEAAAAKVSSVICVPVPNGDGSCPKAISPPPPRTGLGNLIDDWIAGGQRQEAVLAKYGTIENWNTKFVTNLKCVFSGAKKFNANISQWDMSSVTTLEGGKSFLAKSLQSVDIFVLSSAGGTCQV